ncbi:hypothetical protein [Cytophaga hutchinsonii]|uniref:hypothetical protein n=1 Tax=Cytophaga hutchinsonii TaxID=985 RepID=UPI00116044E8|nr:hypothetical protein [Cytophaga hutchinsonii]
MEAERIRPNTLARQSGNSSTQIYNILNGRKYGTDKLLQIIEALPTMNIYWLLLGEGNMYITQGTATSAETENKGNSDEFLVLQKEIENLQAMVKLQEMTINAYKRSADLADTTLVDLKRIATFYKDRFEENNTTKSA